MRLRFSFIPHPSDIRMAESLSRNHRKPGCAKADDRDTLRHNGSDSRRHRVTYPAGLHRFVIVSIGTIFVSRFCPIDQGLLWRHGASRSSRTRSRHIPFFRRSRNYRRLVPDPGRARTLAASWDIFRGFNDNTIRLLDRRRSFGLVVAAKTPYRYFEHLARLIEPLAEYLDCFTEVCWAHRCLKLFLLNVIDDPIILRSLDSGAF